MCEELKPCPLCGGKVAWVSGAICCRRCGLELHHLTHSYELNIETWNTRTPETCRIEWHGSYFCTGCMTDLPDSLQEEWDEYQAAIDCERESRWDMKPFRYCPKCGRKVVDK